MQFLQSIQALIISAMMLVNPLLLPPNLRTTQPKNQPTLLSEQAAKPVLCQVPSLCGGGIQPLKKWQCDVAVCCNTNGKWNYYYDGRTCETPKPTPTVKPTVQPAAQPKQQVAIVDNKIDCTGPDGKMLRLTFKECREFNQKWGKDITWYGDVNTASDCILYNGRHILADPQTCGDYKNRKVDPAELNKQNNNTQVTMPTYNPVPSVPLITCVVSYPCTGNTFTYRLDSATCLTAQNRATDMCRSYYTPSSPTTTTTPTVTQADIDGYNNKVSQCQNDVARKYSDLIQSCSARFGSSSAAEACRQINTQERDQQYKNCGSKI